jgi:hypothetical protein
VRLSATILPVLVLFSASASALTLDDLSAGKTVCGPNLSVKDMKGKVVFVNYWGTH